MITYEEGRVVLTELISFRSANPRDRNEATTRLQLVDKLLFDVLGWNRDTDCELEEAHGGLFADYTLSAPRRILIVEAKREGNYFEVPAGENRLIYMLSRICRDNQSLRDAVSQAMGYCQTRGVPFGAVTNGHQIVGFVAVRTDGFPPMDGKTVVFPSLEFMLQNFLKLWQTLSKVGIEERHLQHNLLGDAIPEIPRKLALGIAIYPGLKNRNIFQADLQIVSELVIEDIAKEVRLETDFLKDCYCESSALSQHSLVSKHILETRYASLFDAETGGPAIESAKTKRGVAPDILAASVSRRPILLIGDVGVGKSIFIKHLVRVDAKQAFESVIDLYVDLGYGATLESSLKDYVLGEIARQLEEKHGVDSEDAKIVRGVYDLELKKFAKGIYGSLKESNPGKFQEKELDFLEEKMQHKDRHLRSVLVHLEKARRKQVVIFVDNCDQRDDVLQQEAFLIAQEISSSWPATVFVTLRPETFYRSLKEGALAGYHPKAFTIAPPRVNLVIEKRLQFGLRITSGNIPVTSLSNPIQGTFTNLDAIIRSFLHTLRPQFSLRECLDNISGGNVRRALDLVREFFGSGHVDTQKIVDIYNRERRYNISPHEFLRAIIFGDNEFYNPDRSPVANIFDVSSGDSREHFLTPILISLLANASGGSIEQGFVETARIYDQIQGLGFVPDQLDSALIRAHKFKLVETSARRAPHPGHDLPPALRITTSGAYHVQRLAGMFTYIDAIIVDTPIFDFRIRSAIKDVSTILNRATRARVFKEYLDTQWQPFDGSEAWFPWPALSQILEAEIIDVERRNSGGTQGRLL